MVLPAAWLLYISAGLYLSVILELMEGLYPGSHSFVVRRRVESGTAVKIMLPLRVMGEE